MSTFIQTPDTVALSAGELSIAVISPDAERRSAAMDALGEIQGGQIQEFISTLNRELAARTVRKPESEERNSLIPVVNARPPASPSRRSPDARSK